MMKSLLKRIHQISSYLLVALGVVHLLYTTQVYERLNLDAFWFIGSGVGIILAGLMNLMFLRMAGRDRVVWALCLLGNLISIGLSLLAIWLIREPQVFLGTLLFILATVATALRRATSA